MTEEREHVGPKCPHCGTRDLIGGHRKGSDAAMGGRCPYYIEGAELDPGSALRTIYVRTEVTRKALAAEKRTADAYADYVKAHVDKVMDATEERRYEREGWQVLRTPEARIVRLAREGKSLTDEERMRAVNAFLELEEDSVVGVNANSLKSWVRSEGYGTEEELPEELQGIVEITVEPQITIKKGS